MRLKTRLFFTTWVVAILTAVSTLALFALAPILGAAERIFDAFRGFIYGELPGVPESIFIAAYLVSILSATAFLSWIFARSAAAPLKDAAASIERLSSEIAIVPADNLGGSAAFLNVDFHPVGAVPKNIDADKVEEAEAIEELEEVEEGADQLEPKGEVEGERGVSALKDIRKKGPPRGAELALLATRVEEAAALLAARKIGMRRQANERAEALASALGEIRARSEREAQDNMRAARLGALLVPPAESLPLRPETQFAARYRPGSGIYDALRVGKNGVALFCAEVTGRSAEALLATAVLKNAFRSRASWRATAAEVIDAVGNDLASLLGDSGLVAAAQYVFIDLESGTLSAANAGCRSAYLYRRRTGAVESLGHGMGFLRSDSSSGASSQELSLEEGDRIVIASTGLGAASGLSPHGSSSCEDTEDIFAIVARQGGSSLEQLAGSLETFLVHEAEGQAEDLGIIIIVCEFRSFATPERREGASMRKPAPSEDWNTLAGKAAELARTGHYEAAVSLYERVLSIEPEDAHALNNLGAIYWHLGRIEEAAQRFAAAFEIAPNDQRIAKNLSLAERSLKAEAESV